MQKSSNTINKIAKQTKPHFVELAQHGDDRGSLIVLEEASEIPFSVKRVFFIRGSDSSAIRGRHANRNSEFLLVNVSGSCKVKTIEEDGTETVFELNQPNVGIYLPRMVWKEMYDFSKDSVLLALTNTLYDSNEYIRDLKEFLQEGNNNHTNYCAN